MSNATLLDLPPEIFHRIFYFLDADTIALRIRCVCKYLFNTVNAYNQFKLSLESIYGSDLVSISRIIKPENFISLAMYVHSDYGKYGKTNLFLSLYELNSFTQLQSLYFYSPLNETVTLLLEHVSLKNLRVLSIIYRQRGYPEGIIPLTLRNIVQFNIPKLQLYDPDFDGAINWPSQCKLEYLMLSKCSYSEYHRILSSLPYLRTMAIDCIHFANKKPNKLDKVSVSQDFGETQSKSIKITIAMKTVVKLQ